MQRTFKGSCKFGSDAAEMGFDQGTKMIKMNCKKISGRRYTEQVEERRAREAVWSCHGEGGARGQDAAH